MRFCSTFGSKDLSNLSFEETLFMTYLPDGGLIMPESVERLPEETMKSWSKLSYKEICLEMLMLYIGEDFIERNELKEIIAKAYSTFPPDVVELTEVYDRNFIAELYHGQTYAFKDLAMVISSALLNYALKKCGKHGVLGVCTSGDTGSSVACAVKGLNTIDALIFFPGGERINKFQRRQITTVGDENIHSFEADCCCDTFDLFLMRIWDDVTEKFPDLVMTSLNSIIFIRVLAQTVHLMYSYFQATKTTSTTTNLQHATFVIPTGGCGHLTSATMLQKMGFPISIVPVFNEKNLNTHNFLTGKDLVFNAPVTSSLSVAMDIQFPTNMQRLLYLWSNFDTGLVKDIMSSFNKGSAKIPLELLEKVQTFTSPIYYNDEDIKETMQKCWQTKSYSLDPHTALGFTYYYKVLKGRESSQDITVFAGCASPVKFYDTLSLVDIPLSSEHKRIMEELDARMENSTILPEDQSEWVNVLINRVRLIAEKHRKKEN